MRGRLQLNEDVGALRLSPSTHNVPLDAIVATNHTLDTEHAFDNAESMRARVSH